MSDQDSCSLKQVGCGSCGCPQEKEKSFGVFIITTTVALLLVVFLNVTDIFKDYSLLGFLVAYILVVYELFIAAFKNLKSGELFDENFLIAVASLGAMIIGEYNEAVAVVVFYNVGELLQELAVKRSRKRIADLMDIKLEVANLRRGKEVVKVDPLEVKISEIIVVKPGEKIPLDGIVIKGSAALDTKALTGESLWRNVTSNDEVISGMINVDGLLEIRVTKDYENSTVAKILDLVENSANKKANSERFIRKFARIYTPVVVLIAFLVSFIPPLLQLGSMVDWVYRGLSFLIISCPCALVISIPLSFFGGIGGAAHQGILIKGSNYLELLKDVKTVVFDKTGTLTTGRFQVVEVLPAASIKETELLYYAALAETNSNHPVAEAIRAAYNKKITEDVTIKEEAGMGLIAKTADNRTVYVGNQALMKKAGITAVREEATTAIHVAVGKLYYGCLLLADISRAGIQQALMAIKAQGVERLLLLSGDKQASVAELAKELEISEYYSELLPADKVEILENLLEEGGVTAFVGDGINDAPVLRRADIGIALGGIGSDAAIAAADVVIMNDDIGKIAKAITIAKKTNRLVWQNIVFALSSKTLIMLLAFFGLSHIWLALFADVGVALLALLNALRIVYGKLR